MEASPRFKSLHYTDRVQSLQAACEWMSIERGRAAQYGKLVREFFEKGERSREHILAYNESCEIVDIYELWEASIKHFPGLEPKVRAVFSGGPILREEERADTSSNRPRNDAFVYLLAGKLIRSDVKVTAVDGIVLQGVSCHSEADIAFDWNGSTINIECKRPQTQEAVEKRVKEACQQLTNPNRQGRQGIIALDCSAFVRPLERLPENDSAVYAERLLAQLLGKAVLPKVESCCETTIQGFLLFARAPAMIQAGHSLIVSPGGNHFTYMRPDCISTWLVIPNS